MKKSKAQKQQDKAFLAKIGTLTFGFGKGHKLPTVKCPDCGESMDPVGFLVGPFRVNAPKPPQEEQSFPV